MSKYLDTRQAAAYVGLDEPKFRLLSLPRIRIGAKLLFRKEDLDELQVPSAANCDQCARKLSLRGTFARCGREHLSPALVHREDPPSCDACTAANRVWCATCCHRERAEALAQSALILMQDAGHDWFDLVSAATAKEESVVYFLRAECGPVKIGTTTDFEKRLATLRAMSPSPLTVLGVMPGGVHAERGLHERFQVHRLHGEWFTPDPGMIQELTRMSRMPVILSDEIKKRVVGLRQESLLLWDHIWREVIGDACREFDKKRPS